MFQGRRLLIATKHKKKRGLRQFLKKNLECNPISGKLYPHKKMTEDPTYCDFCNP